MLYLLIRSYNKFLHLLFIYLYIKMFNSWCNMLELASSISVETQLELLSNQMLRDNQI